MLSIEELKTLFSTFPTLDPHVLKAIHAIPESERSPWQVFLYPMIPSNLGVLFPFEYPDFYRLLVKHASRPEVDESFLLQAAQYLVDYLIEQLSSEQISLNDIGDIGDIMIENFSYPLLAAIYHRLLMKRLDGFDTIDMAAYVYAYIIHQFFEKEKRLQLSEILHRIFSETELSEVDSERFQKSTVLRWLLVTDLFKQSGFLQSMLALLLSQWSEPISSDILNRKNKSDQTLLMRLCETGSETEIVKVMVQTLLRREDIDIIDILFTRNINGLINYLHEPKAESLISLFARCWSIIENKVTGSFYLSAYEKRQRWLCEICYAYNIDAANTVRNQALQRLISYLIERPAYVPLYASDLHRLHDLEQAFNENVRIKNVPQSLIVEMESLLNQAYGMYGVAQHIKDFTRLLVQLDMLCFKHVQKERLQTSLIQAKRKGKLMTVEALLITACDLGIVIDPLIFSTTVPFFTSILSDEREGILRWSMLSGIAEETILQKDSGEESEPKAESTQVTHSNRTTFSMRKRAEVFFAAFFPHVRESINDQKVTETCRGNEGESESDNGEALLRACFFGRIDVVKMLLRGRVDVNSRNTEGKTALMMACEHSLASEKHVQVVSFLLTQKEIIITKDIFRSKYFYKFVFCLDDLKLESFMALKNRFPKDFQQSIYTQHLPKGYGKYLQPFIEICHAYLADDNKKRILALNRYFLRALNPQCGDSKRYFSDFKLLMKAEKNSRGIAEKYLGCSLITNGCNNILNSVFEVFMTNRHAVFKELLIQLGIIEMHMLKTEKVSLSAQERKDIIYDIMREVWAIELTRVSSEASGTLNVSQSMFNDASSCSRRGEAHAGISFS